MFTFTNTAKMAATVVPVDHTFTTVVLFLVLFLSLVMLNTIRQAVAETERLLVRHQEEQRDAQQQRKGAATANIQWQERAENLHLELDEIRLQFLQERKAATAASAQKDQEEETRREERRQLEADTRANIEQRIADVFAAQENRAASRHEDLGAQLVQLQQNIRHLVVDKRSRANAALRQNIKKATASRARLLGKLDAESRELRNANAANANLERPLRDQDEEHKANLVKVEGYLERATEAEILLQERCEASKAKLANAEAQLLEVEVEKKRLVDEADYARSRFFDAEAELLELHKRIQGLEAPHQQPAHLNIFQHGSSSSRTRHENEMHQADKNVDRCDSTVGKVFVRPVVYSAGTVAAPVITHLRQSILEAARRATAPSNVSGDSKLPEQYPWEKILEGLRAVDETLGHKQLPLGKGATGCVYEWHNPEYPSPTKATFAVKLLRVSQFGGRSVDQLQADANYLVWEDTHGRSFEYEWDVLNSLNHENILKAFGFTFDPMSISRAMIMEKLDGSCASLVQSEQASFSPERGFQFMKDIASGLAYLHDEGFAHCDVKPDNCGYRVRKQESGASPLTVERFVLFDLNIATRIGEPLTTAGTPGFRAPEVYDAEKTTAECDGKNDIWSLFVCAVHLCGLAPVPDFTVPEDENIRIVQAFKKQASGLDMLDCLDMRTTQTEKRISARGVVQRCLAIAELPSAFHCLSLNRQERQERNVAMGERVVSLGSGPAALEAKMELYKLEDNERKSGSIGKGKHNVLQAFQNLGIVFGVLGQKLRR